MSRDRRSIADTTAFALALVVAFGALYALLARYALDAFPFSGDEYSLTLQAELFAKGLLKTPAPPHLEWLRLDHVVIDQYVRSKYALGGPALLSIGARHGATWLVTPIEGALALLVIWHTVKRVLGARPALVALVMLGASPLFTYNSASFLTHTPTLLFLGIAFASLASWTQRHRDGWLVLIGLAIGCTYLIRPLDAMLFGVTMLVFRSPRAVIIPALAALPFVIANFWYQNAMFGSPFTDGYHAYEPTFTALYGDAAQNPISWRHIVSPEQWWNHIDLIGQMCTQWTLPGTVIVALFGAYAPVAENPARQLRRFSIALIAVFVVTLVAMIALPDDGPRPRYLSVTLIPIVFLAAAGFASTMKAITQTFGPRVRTILVVCGIVFGLAQLGAYLTDHIPKVWKREGLYQASADLPYGAVVIVRAQYPSRYARNGPFFDGILYLSAPAATTALEVAAAYPDRPIWEAHEGVPWTLVRVR